MVSLRCKEWSAALATLELNVMQRKQKGAKANWLNPQMHEEARTHASTMFDALRELKQWAFAIEPDPHSELAACMVASWLDLWKVAERTYNSLKDTQRALDFDDLEIRALDILRQGAAKPATRIGRYLTSLRQTLVDEHQDINPVQQQIISHLAPRQQPGRLFVVGDTKQSIYRFRQAQVTEFAQLIRDLEEDCGHSNIHLDTSFRTHCKLTAATNMLFDSVFQPEVHGEFAHYEAKPLPLRSDLEPPASLLDPACELHVVFKGDAELDSHDLQEAEAKVIANRLIQMHTEGGFVSNQRNSVEPSDSRTFQWRDAAVLLRTKRSALAFVRVFLRAGIPFQWEEDVPILDSLPVQGLLALLRHLQRPHDDFQLAVALRSAVFGIDDESLYWIRTELQMQAQALSNFPEILETIDLQPQQVKRLEQAAATISDLRACMHILTPAQLAQRATQLTSLAEICMADPNRIRGEGHLQDLQAFLDHLRAEEHRTLGELLRQCQKRDLSHRRQAEDAEDDAEGHVRIMTIHKSKGLEFPVVFVPRLDRNPHPGGNTLSNPMWIFDPEYGFVTQLRDTNTEILKPASWLAAQKRDRRMDDAEEKRVLYVACTRAATRLVLTGIHKKDGPPEAPAHTWLHQVLSGFNVNNEFPKPGAEIVLDLQHGEDPFSLLCASWQADEVQLEKAPSLPPVQKPNPEGRSSVVPDSQSQPLELRVEDFRTSSQTSLGQHIGLITHELITQWDVWREQDDLELHATVAARLMREGLSDPSTISKIAGYLHALRQSSLAREIEAAGIRHWELPVTLKVAGNIRSLRIDLLYQTSDSVWRLVDWKTERITDTNLRAVKNKYLPSLASCAQAVREVLGQDPETFLCFLNPDFRLEWISPAELARGTLN